MTEGADNTNERSWISRILFQDVRLSATDWLVDLVICAGAFGFGLLQLTLLANMLIPDDFMRRLLGASLATPTTLAIVATLLTCLPLIIRRISPWISFLLSMLAWWIIEMTFEINSLSLIGPLIALFTLAYLRDRSEAFAACAIALIALLSASFSTLSSTITKLLTFQNTALVIAVFLAGYSLHVRQRYLEEANARALQEQNLRISESMRAKEEARAQEAETKRVMEEERARIGRELHDITAHSLTAISIQAKAVECLLDTSPAEAKESIRSISGISKSSLAEIRAMINALRTPQDTNEVEHEPIHRIADIEELAKYLSDADIDCQIEMDLGDKEIPAYLQAAIYSAAREAVTNVVRHSHAKHVSIRVAVINGDLLLTVADDGTGVAQEVEQRAGHGISGLRERARILGGSMSVDDESDGGLRLTMEIPIETKEE